MTGLLSGIGVGPGDPDLITLKALKALRRAQVVAYPAPPEGESLARSIAAPHLPGGQEEIAIRMSLEPSRFPAAEVYDDAAAALGARSTRGATSRCSVRATPSSTAPSSISSSVWRRTTGWR